MILEAGGCFAGDDGVLGCCVDCRVVGVQDSVGGGLLVLVLLVFKSVLSAWVLASLQGLGCGWKDAG